MLYRIEYTYALKRVFDDGSFKCVEGGVPDAVRNVWYEVIEDSISGKKNIDLEHTEIGFDLLITDTDSDSLDNLEYRIFEITDELTNHLECTCCLGFTEEEFRDDGSEVITEEAYNSIPGGYATDAHYIHLLDFAGGYMHYEEVVLIKPAKRS